MRTLYTLLLIIIFTSRLHAGTDSYLFYKYGQVIVSIQSGSYNRVQEDVKLMGELLNEVCQELEIKDTVLIDFHKRRVYNYYPDIMFSKTEPSPYHVEYNRKGKFNLTKYRKETTNISNVESTIRIVGSEINIKKFLQRATGYLFHQNKIDKTEYYDLFINRTIYKSVCINERYRFNVSRNEDVIVNNAINKILSNKNWLFYPEDPDNPKVNFSYYYQDSLYYVIHKKDSSLLYTTDKIYSISQSLENTHLPSRIFIFRTPFKFNVITYYNFDYFDEKTSMYKDNMIIKDNSEHYILKLLEEPKHLNGSWSPKWVYGETYLLDHSPMFLGMEGPFVLYDANENKIIHTEIIK